MAAPPATAPALDSTARYSRAMDAAEVIRRLSQTPQVSRWVGGRTGVRNIYKYITVFCIILFIYLIPVYEYI